jgi:hypothetical protein
LKLLILLFFPVSLLFTFSDSSAQSNGNYLFVEIRGLSPQRGVPELKEQLKAIPEIDGMEYCEKSGLTILHTKTSAVENRSKVNALLHSLNYKYTIKSEIPIEEARKICDKNSHK